MAKQYSITVTNNSGAFQKYALFNEAPQVSGAVDRIWSNVFATAAVGPEQTAVFNISRQYYAVVGNSQGSPSSGVNVNISNAKPVDLGSKTANGDAVPGTSIGFDVRSETPYFSQDLPKNGRTGSFEVQTTSNFTMQDARNGNFTLGVGVAGNGMTTPLATFIPAPDTSYQITPKNVYYLTSGDFTKGSLVDMARLGGAAKIDFTNLPPNVRVINDETRRFNIQR